jgi:uncharacterized metal-binding protein YceD (DUF177 family)
METEVNALKSYEIPIYGLDNRQYDYTFESDDSFFRAMNQELIQRGNLKTRLALTKSETLIRLDFDIEGSVSQTCDRSLDEYDEPVSVQQWLLLKFADHNEELTDEIELIERNTASINVARYIFEYVSLSLPMKRLHPRFRTEETDENDDEGTLIYRTDAPNDDAPDQPGLAADPRWDALRKLNEN